LLALIFYGYSTGRFSSRKIERATYEDLGFRFVAGGCTQIMTQPQISVKRFYVTTQAGNGATKAGKKGVLAKASRKGRRIKDRVSLEMVACR